MRWKNILIILMAIIAMASVATAYDFDPGRDINLRDRYDIKNVVNLETACLNLSGDYRCAWLLDPEGIPVHNQLSGLQGGTTNQYYHLNQSVHDTVISNFLSWITSAFFDQDLNTTDSVTFVNVTASQFKGKYNWTEISKYLSFDGSTLDFSEAELNSTIDLRTISNYYNASLISTISGTHDGGNLDSIIFPEDDDTYNVSEDPGANPMTIAINFSNVDSFDSIVGRVYYDGGLGHEIQLEIQRSDTGAWENYLDLTDTTDFVNIYVPVFDPEQHVFGNGDVAIRLNHVQSGQPTHNFYIDYFTIVDGWTTLTVADHDALGGRDSKSNHPWALPTDGSRQLTGSWNFGAFNITGTGNITASYFFGDGSQLTGITITETDPLWTANQSSYWDTSNDLDTVISNNEIAEAKIEFTTACDAGEYYRLALMGDDLVCTKPTDTTYSASGVLLDLTGTTFSVNNGTLTNTKGCKYVTGTGIVCDQDYLTSYTESDPLWTGNMSDVAFTDEDEIFDGSLVVTDNFTVDTNALFVNSNTDRVGIGTNAPNSTFHIKANIPGIVGSHHAGQIIIQNPTDSVWSNAVITGYESDGAGNPDQQLWYLGSVSGSNSDIILLNRRNSKLQLGTDGVAKMTILGDGNVGIGTTSPGDKLTIYDTSSVNVRVQSVGPDTDAGLILRTATAPYWTLYEDESDYRKFKIKDSVGGDRLTIDTSGNVGINTTTPQNKLNVIGDINATGDFLTESGMKISGAGAGLSIYDTGQNAFFKFGRQSGQELSFTVSDINAQIVYNQDSDEGGAHRWEFDFGGSQNFSKSYYTFRINDGEIMNIQQAGIGIGTATPQNTLNVIGDGNFTGTIYMNENAVLTSFTETDPYWTANQSLYVRRNTWTDIDDYPTGCGAGTAVRIIGDTLTCIDVGEDVEDIWVNESGDTMSGILNLGNNAITNINWSGSDDGSGSGLDADLFDAYNSAYFMPLNTSVYGNFDFNGGWGSGGFSIIGGDIYAQTGYFYNITGLDVQTLKVNGSIIPQTGFDNQFDLGSSSLRWNELFLGGKIYAGDWTNVTITESQVSDADWWDADADIDADEISESKIAFSTACPSGSYYYLSGNDLACKADPLDTITEWKSLCTDCVETSDIGDILDASHITDIYLFNTGDTASGTYNFDSNTFVVDAPDDRVGIGTASPAEKLEVVGGVKIGTTAGTNAGTVRFDSNVFQGYNGTDWLSLSGDVLLVDELDVTSNTCDALTCTITGISPGDKLFIWGKGTTGENYAVTITLFDEWGTTLDTSHTRVSSVANEAVPWSVMSNYTANQTSHTFNITATYELGDIKIMIVAFKTVGLGEERWVDESGDTMTGNLIVSGANVTADYFFGNGSQLTGIATTESDPLWTGNQSSYWNTGTDLDTVISTDEITELKIDFNTVCGAGNHLYVSGNNLACEADDDTTYTAGDHLTLTGTDFDVDDDFLLNTGDNATGNYAFDTDTLFIDAANNRVGIGTTDTETFAQLTIESPYSADFVVRSGDVKTTVEASGEYDYGWMGTATSHLLHIGTSGESRMTISATGAVTMSQSLGVTGTLDAPTLNTGQGDYELYAMNQDVETTDAVTFATIDTGYGANDLWDMNQHVLTGSAVTFASINSYATDHSTPDVDKLVNVVYDTTNCPTASTTTIGTICVVY